MLAGTGTSLARCLPGKVRAIARSAPKGVGERWLGATPADGVGSLRKAHAVSAHPCRFSADEIARQQGQAALTIGVALVAIASCSGMDPGTESSIQQHTVSAAARSFSEPELDENAVKVSERAAASGVIRDVR